MIANIWIPVIIFLAACRSFSQLPRTTCGRRRFVLNAFAATFIDDLRDGAEITLKSARSYT